MSLSTKDLHSIPAAAEKQENKTHTIFKMWKKIVHLRTDETYLVNEYLLVLGRFRIKSSEFFGILLLFLGNRF